MEEVTARLTPNEVRAVLEVADVDDLDVDTYNDAVVELEELVERLDGELDLLTEAVDKIDGDGIRNCISKLRSIARDINTEVENARTWEPVYPEFDTMALDSAANKLDLARFT